MRLKGLLLLLMSVVAIPVSSLSDSGDVRNLHVPDLVDATPRRGQGTTYNPIQYQTNAEIAEQARRDKEIKEYNAPDLIDAPADIINNAWIIPTIYRWFKRNAENEGFPKDPNFKVTYDYLDSLPTLYTIDDRSKLVDTSSQLEYNAVVRQINEDLTRERAAAAHGPFLNIAVLLLDPPKLAFIVLLIYILWLAIKGATRLSRATLIYSLLLTIRGGRKVSNASKSLWNEAKAIDNKVTEIEHSDTE